MKNTFLKLTFLLILGTITYAASAQEIWFEKFSHNFGKLERGPQVFHEFMFVNTGDKPLVIYTVDKTCGCTTPEWPKDSIMPGDTAYIKFGFDTDRPPGGFAKGLTVHSNAITKPDYGLIFEGEIIDIKGKIDSTPKMEDN